MSSDVYVHTMQSFDHVQFPFIDWNTHKPNMFHLFTRFMNGNSHMLLGFRKAIWTVRTYVLLCITCIIHKGSYMPAVHVAQCIALQDNIHDICNIHITMLCMWLHVWAVWCACVGRCTLLMGVAIYIFGTPNESCLMECSLSTPPLIYNNKGKLNILLHSTLPRVNE